MTKKNFIALADVVRACEPCMAGSFNAQHHDGKMSNWTAMRSACMSCAITSSSLVWIGSWPGR